MIAVRMFSREHWEHALRELGCQPLEGLGPLNTAEWWRAPWSFVFTVPIEGPEDRVGERELGELVEMIGSRRPN